MAIDGQPRSEKSQFFVAQCRVFRFNAHKWKVKAWTRGSLVDVTSRCSLLVGNVRRTRTDCLAIDSCKFTCTVNTEKNEKPVQRGREDGRMDERIYDTKIGRERLKFEETKVRVVSTVQETPNNAFGSVNDTNNEDDNTTRGLKTKHIIRRRNS